MRDNAEEITSRLSAEIAARVVAAGVWVVESRLTALLRLADRRGDLRQQQATQQVVNTGTLYQ